MDFKRYYQSSKDYFWAWEDAGDVIAVTGGSTIAYTKYAAELLETLAENGLPSFGAFLLTMIATNNTIDDSLHQVKEKVAALSSVFPKEVNFGAEFFHDAFAFLEILRGLPAEYKTGKRRQVLLQTIFAEGHNKFNVSTSKGLVLALKDKRRDRNRTRETAELIRQTTIRDFRSIALLLRQFSDAASIIKAMGELPELEEAELQLLESTSVQKETYEDFVEELMDHPHTFHIAALIKPIWAGFNIPIFNAHPSEQPLGGVSDLSNKGDFDKLLLSEFANDDLVFMNRVANNEALYIHREMPPVRDKLHRVILVDISLKAWGTPKILAFATYIAIARHPKTLSECSAFVVGNTYTAVSCYDTGQVIDALQQVDAGLHAAKGLAAFLEAHKQDKQLEIFYITTTDALKYPQVQAVMAAYNPLFKYIITATADGELNFYQNKNNARRRLQTIRLPLEKLWVKNTAKNKTFVPLKAKPAQDAAYLPLLLPLPRKVKKMLVVNGGEKYCVANRCLLKQASDKDRTQVNGWELVLKNVPGNAFYEIGKMDSGEVIFLHYNLQNQELHIVNLHTKQQAKTIFDKWKKAGCKEFLFDRDQKFKFYHYNLHIFSF
ncbi:hypothetical protein [Ferruginibacter sp.]